MKTKPVFKVAHVCTYPDGGASRAAFRIHEALLKSGCQSSFVTIYSHQESIKSATANSHRVPDHETFIQKQFNRIQFRLKKHLGIQLIEQRAKAKSKEREMYSLNWKVLTIGWIVKLPRFHFRNLIFSIIPW